MRLELPVADKSELDSLLMLRVAGRDGNLVPLTEIVMVRDADRHPRIDITDISRHSCAVLRVRLQDSTMGGNFG